ncbi:hypothetical protein ACFL23_02650 [Patescibacteria group bacterium]
MGIDFKTVRVCVNIIEPILSGLIKQKGEWQTVGQSEVLKDYCDKSQIHYLFFAISTLCEEFNQPYNMRYVATSKNWNTWFKVYKKLKVREAVNVADRMLDVAKAFLEEEKKVKRQFEDE